MGGSGRNWMNEKDGKGIPLVLLYISLNREPINSFSSNSQSVHLSRRFTQGLFFCLSCLIQSCLPSWLWLSVSPFLSPVFSFAQLIPYLTPSFFFSFVTSVLKHFPFPAVSTFISLSKREEKMRRNFRMDSLESKAMSLWMKHHRHMMPVSSLPIFSQIIWSVVRKTAANLFMKKR